MAHTPQKKQKTPDATVFGYKLADVGITDTRFARLLNEHARRHRRIDLSLARTTVGHWRNDGMKPRDPEVAAMAATVLSGLVGYTVAPADLGWRGEGGCDAAAGLTLADTVDGVLADLAGLAARDAHPRTTTTVPFTPGAFPAPALASLTGVAEPVTGTAVTSAAGEAARETARTFRLLDARYGAGEFRRQVAVLLHEAAKAAQADATTDRGTLGGLAELAQLAGWLSADCGRPGVAQRYHVQALGLAELAGDGLLAGRVLAGMADLTGDQGYAREGLTLSRAALSRAGGQAPPVVRAVLHRVHAEAAARCGDAAGCAKALGPAEEASSFAVPGEGPGWAVHAGEAATAACRGRCLLRLGEHTRAAEAFSRASGAMEDGRARACAFAGLALSRAAGGDVGGALDAAREALVVGAGVRSARLTGLVREVDAALAADGRVGVRAWRGRAAEWVRGREGSI